ncbi:MAG: MbcA/ParS/Xre antitoxin family protein [Methylotenera sp.]|nr:MbcA/ParS/Xre antitoxin family protein [Methylotenera sp.]
MKIQEIKMSDLEHVRKLATEVFGSDVKADHWLTTYHQVFDTEPIKFLETADGVVEVMKVLSAIQYEGAV